MASPLAVALAPAALGAAGAVVGGRRRVQAPDLGALRTQVDAGANREREIASNLRGQLSPLTEAFQANRTRLSAGLKTDVADRGAAFKTEMADLGTEKANNLSTTLRQNVLSAQPEINRMTKENLAATGGLQRGAAPAAFARNAAAAAEEIGRGEAAIQQDRLKGLQDAAKTTFGADIDAVSKATGLDADTIQAVLNSGREDLVREAQSLIEAERTRTSNMLGITQAGNTNALAAQTAKAQGDNALLQALMGAASQGVGSYFGAKAK